MLVSGNNRIVRTQERIAAYYSVIISDFKHIKVFLRHKVMGQYPCCLCLLRTLVFVNGSKAIEAICCSRCRYYSGLSMTIDDAFSRLPAAFSRLHGMELTKDKNVIREETLNWHCQDWIWSSIGILLGYVQWAPYKTEQGRVTRITHFTVDWRGNTGVLQPIQSLYSSHQTLLLECNFIWRTWYILLEQWPIHVQQQVLPLRRFKKLYSMFGLYFWTNRRSKYWEPCRLQKLFINFVCN